MLLPFTASQKQKTSLSLTIGTAMALAVGLTSCERLTERMEIKESREISDHAIMPKAEATSAERFFDTPAPQPPKAENPLAWITPEGWSEAPAGAASGMRLINLQFGPKGEGECYLSIMPGQAGGLAANVNRWRTQMGQPAYTPDELAALPRKTFVGRDATYVAFDGDFKGVGAEAASTGYRLLGLVQEAPEFTLFVKMTGPKDLVTANEAAFDQFAQSVSLRR
ncbi:MAG TPA: hypothetical protein VK956_11135 [Verrucomicrobium sp.]|nr:hypothetical protein [Verrucomicrobium sp.]